MLPPPALALVQRERKCPTLPKALKLNPILPPHHIDPFTIQLIWNTSVNPGVLSGNSGGIVTVGGAIRNPVSPMSNLRGLVTFGDMYGRPTNGKFVEELTRAR